MPLIQCPTLADIGKAKTRETLLSRCEIPIIDLAHIGTDTCPMRSVVKRVGAQLHKALSEKGLALLVNHGISEDKLKAAYGALDEFCALPKDQQDKFLPDPVGNHGYMKPGMELIDGKTMELRHTFNVTSIDSTKLPEETIVPHFNDSAAPLATDFTNLSKLLLKSLAVALELPPSYFIDRHSLMLSGNGKNQTTMRMIYYPPVLPSDEPCSCEWECERTKEPELAEDVLQCGAHCDYGTFTLLAQECEGGLEVKLPNNDKWQTVGHLQGALLVNTGELLAAWTSDRYPALPHRVVVPSHPYLRSRGRHCIAFFCHPDEDTDLTPVVGPATVAVASPCAIVHRSRSIHNRIINAYHHLQKRFRETYA